MKQLDSLDVRVDCVIPKVILRQQRVLQFNASLLENLNLLLKAHKMMHVGCFSFIL
jgi:hypothetical protein